MAPRVLIATDADIRGVLACAAAAREYGPGQLVWLPPGTDRALQGVIEASGQAQAELYEHTWLAPEVPPPVDGTPTGERATRVLLEAGFAAAGRGTPTVIWAGAVGVDQQCSDPLEGLALLQARTLLVGRLVELDWTGGEPFRIQVPYADLTDRQLADLVLDMDLPIWTCWWWSLGRGPRGVEGADIARAEYQRWSDIFKEIGWQEGMPGPATIGAGEASRSRG
jgi:hypothetical protein